LQRRELTAAVAAVDLRDVGELYRAYHRSVLFTGEGTQRTQKTQKSTPSARPRFVPFVSSVSFVFFFIRPPPTHYPPRPRSSRPPGTARLTRRPAPAAIASVRSVR